MLVYPTGIPTGGSGYTITNALMLDGSADCLSKSFSSAGTEETWACSFWAKGFKINTTQYIFASRVDGNNTGYIELLSGSGNQLQMRDYDDGVGTPAYQVKTSAVLRDPTAWYHFLCVMNSSNGTSTDRQRIYINGVRQEASSPTYSGSGYASAVGINSANTHYIGQDGNDANDYYGYLAEFIFLDGSTTTTTVDSDNKLTDNELGQFDNNGVWVPIKPPTSLGTNGFHLDFKVAPGTGNGAGTDVSGNGNHFTDVSLTTTQQVTDTCTDDADNNIGNYATLNPLTNSNSSAVLSNGNLTWRSHNANAWHGIRATQVISGTDKIYWEVLCSEDDHNTWVAGVGSSAAVLSNSPNTAGSFSYIQPSTNSGEKYDGTPISPTMGNTAGDIWGFAVDYENQDLYLSKNGQWLNGSAFSGGTGPGTIWDATLSNTDQLFPIIQGHNQGETTTMRFLEGSWSYSAPANYISLNTANLSAPTVKNSSEFFKTVEFSGTGSAQNIDTVGFQPDLLIIKSRTSTANFNWVDSVRGAANLLWSNAATSQSAESTSVTGFRDAGFSVGSDTGSYVNISGQTMVAFCMKAGGAASSNVEGSVTSSVSAASHGGFSIGTYSGTGSATTVGHGLSRAPSWVIVKMTSGSGTQTWTVWQEDIFNAANDEYIILSSSAAKTNGASFSSTAPSSTVISIGNDATNQSGSTNVFYAFAKTPGLIGSGSYTGNGSADGPMIVVDDGGSGFKPAWLMVKRTNNTDDWKVSNSVMSPFNPVLTDSNLNINTSAAADTPSGPIDYLANGFKPRLSNGPWNATGDNYIYLAFAENPFGGDGVAQARAR